MTSTAGARMNVMYLEPVTAPTTLDRTHPHVPRHHQGPDGGGDCLSQIGVEETVEVLGDETHLSPTEDLA
ncbi:MAG: hypothetical protein ACRDWA_09705 [Acidimicrobiia bacterium]